MEKYKRLHKIEFLFYGLATGFYFGGQTYAKTAMFIIFLICVLLALLGFWLDKREQKRSIQNPSHIN